MIAGSELQRGIKAAMARESVPSISELARRSHVRRDTMYGWFRKPTTRVSAASVEKLAAVLGSQPGDPWFEEPTERTLDPEAMAAIDAAFARLGDRLIDWLDERLPHSGHPGEP